MSEMLPPKQGPAILLYDIETSPSLVYTWTNWQTNVVATKEDWQILSFAYKWLGSTRTGFVSRQGQKDDKLVVKSLHALFDQADVVIAHNGDKFDQKKAATRFLFHGFPPPSPFQEIDTLKEAKRYFSHYSNSLNELSRYHSLGEKVHHTGIELWLECMADNPRYWKLMEKYNRQDVALLEQLYLALLPWIGSPGRRGHPNRGHWSKDSMVCPKCGSHNLIRRGWHRTSFSEFQTWQCKDCGGYSRGRQRRPQIEKKVELV